MGIYWVLFGGSVNLSIHLKYNLLCYEAESLQFLEPLGCEGISFSSSNPWNLLGLPLPKSFLSHQLVQFSSDTQSCPTLCNPMDCSTPDFPVHHQLKELTCPSCPSCPSSWWCHPTISSSVIPFSSHPQSFPASGSFQMSQFFTSSGQSNRVSVSALVLPMNIQDWFPLELISSRIGWLNLLAAQWVSSLLQHPSSKASIPWCSAFSIVQLSHPYTTSWKNHSFD